MKEIKFYRVHVYSDREKFIEKIGYETIELAKQETYNDMREDNFFLFEVNMVFDGKVSESEKYIGQLVSGRNLKKFESKEDSKNK